MSIGTQLTEPNTARQIGKWGTISRLFLGSLFLYVAFSDGVGTDDAVIGLAVLPTVVSVALALRGRDAPPLRFYGGAGYGLNFLMWAIAFSLAPVPTLLFGGVAQLLAAARGYAGCELFVFSNWLRRRDDQIACPVHSLVDVAAARADGRQRAEVC